MILDNGVIRTLDPSLPTCGALAIAGPHRRGRRRHARVGAADARSASTSAAAACCPRSPTRTSTSRPGRSRDATCASRRPTRSPRRSRSSPRHPRGAGPGSAARAGATPPGAEPPTRGRRSTPSPATRRPRSGRRTTTRSGSTPPALARAGGDLDVPGGVVERDADGRADGDPARGVGLALPRPLRRRSPRTSGSTRRARASASRTRAASPRSTTRTAGSAPPRSSAGSTSTKGCRCASGSRSRPTGCRELAALPLRSRIGDDFLRLGYLKTFMDGTLGSQTALMLDGSGVRDHEPRGARGDHPRRRRRRLAGRGARDRRPGEPRRARRLRGDAGRLAAARAPAPDRARAVSRPRRHARGSPSSASPARSSSRTPRPTATSPSASGATGSRARYAFRSLWDSGAVVANGSDAPVEELDPLAGIRAGVLRTIDDRPAWRPERGADDRAGDRRLDRHAGLARGRRAPPREAPARASSPISSCSPATRSRARRTSSSRSRSSRRWSAAAGCTSRLPGIERRSESSQPRRYDPDRGYTHDAPGSPVRDLLGRGLRRDRRRQVDGADRPRALRGRRAASRRSSTRAPGSARGRSPSGCAGSRPRRSSIRRSYAESPPRVEYELTEKGAALLPAHHRDAPVRPRLARLRRPLTH